MLLQFILENTHFALNLVIALILFAVFWLYFDAWTNKKQFKEVPKFSGFLVLSIAFVIHAVFLETNLIQDSLISKELHQLVFLVVKGIGYILLIIGIVIDPLQPHPEHEKKKAFPAILIIPGTLIPLVVVLPFLMPFLAITITILYLRRATIGIEDHLKPISYSFIFISIYELLYLGNIFRDSLNVDIYNFVAAFGPLWIFEHLVLIVAILILGKWVFFYLLKRLQSQLFMYFTTFILVIFLLITVSFTTLILNNLRGETLKQLEIDVRVLNYAINSKKAEVLSDTDVMAQSPQVQEAIINSERGDLFELAQSFLLTKKESFLVIVDDNGQVLVRGEDKDRIGDSLSDDALIKRALLGESAASVVSKDGAIAPEVSVRASTPIRVDDEIIGVVMAGEVIDNAFVDGIREATGLTVTIYGDNQISATTILSADGKSRLVGLKEEDSDIREKVLLKGENRTTSVSILNVPYFAAYLPLMDVDNSPVGMLFVGKPEVGVLQTAGRSIELTFFVAAILLVASILPSYLISKQISKQLE